MKINVKIHPWIIWTGVGLGSLVVIGFIILLQLASIERNYPVQYGAETYTSNLLAKICKK